jgi:OmpA-OmpF porin, OOP family
MSRSEVRTSDGWGGFDRLAWIIALLLLLLLLLLWIMGKGPNQAGCCGPAAVVPAPVAVVAEPPKVEPPKVQATPVAPVVEAPKPPAEPVIDCNKIMEGVAIQFDVNKASLSDAGRRALDQVMKCLNDNVYEIAGHTDSDGSDASNQTLSEARATSVVAYLKSKGIPAAKMVAAGYGEKKPIAENTTTAGKAKNRRITFTPK